jgi:hypothetical protein
MVETMTPRRFPAPRITEKIAGRPGGDDNFIANRQTSQTNSGTTEPDKPLRYGPSRMSPARGHRERAAAGGVVWDRE